MEKISIDLNTRYQDSDSKSGSELSFDIITNPDSLYSLREEWTELYDKADKPYFTQSFEWNWCCWQTASKLRGERLHCLIIRCEGQAVLIWPLVISRNYYFWSIARPLAIVSTEYSDVLVDTAKDSRALTELALQRLIKTCPCDLIQLPETRADSLLYYIARNANGIPSSTTSAPYVTWENYPNWDSFYHRLSKKMRQNWSRQFRRLAELGTLRFEMLSRDDAYQEELTWIIQTKRNWVTAKNKEWSPFNSNYIDFLSSIIGYGGEHGRVQLCVLKLDDKPISGQLMRIDRERVEFVIIAYDTAYSIYSPAQIMTKHCLQWAFERHLTVDFRIGDAAFKRHWTPESYEVVSYDICRNLFGKAYVSIRTAHHKTKMLNGCRKYLMNLLNSRKSTQCIP